MESSSVSAKLSYRHVGENLYRRESSGVYYALIKKGGKQFRRSLKTQDLGLAVNPSDNGGCQNTPTNPNRPQPTPLNSVGVSGG
jgi:hypothetical protein